MVLDIDLFREEKPNGNPELIRKSQRERFSDVTLVDKVINLDKAWVKGWLSLIIEVIDKAIVLERFDNDNWNRMRNLCNKVIGEKKKVRI